MIKINCYTTTQDDLHKTFCKLAEKCYYANLRTNVITQNADYTKSLDRVLWTYSKKHFIPHATNADPSPEKQPIYITDKLENPNQAESIIFINPDKSTLLESTAKDSELNIGNFQKISLLLDDTQKISHLEINNILKKTPIKTFEINLFVKNEQGMWQKTPTEN